MMNSSTNDNIGDDFGANPFRSVDVFYDESDAQNQHQQSQQQQQQQQQQPTNSFSYPMMTTNNNSNNGMMPSGPMDNMNMNMNMASPLQFQQQPAGLMAPSPQLQPMAQQQQQQQQQQPTTSWWGNILMCLNLDSYKMYFDIDADDIVTRIRAVILHFYKPEHFRNNVVGPVKTAELKGPDLYGPFWITMTLIFILGVTANFHAFIHHTTSIHTGGSSSSNSNGGGNTTTTTTPSTTTAAEDEFDYDINHLLNAAYICCGFVFVLPTTLWITTQCCMSMKALTLAEWVCLYGYSLVPFLPVAVLCIIPFAIVSWVLLAVATAVSVLLVVRNVAHPLLANDVGQAKAPPVILIILGAHVVFFLFLKFAFFHHSG
ncbi:Yip1 domain containing protein [Nitzschia inconspicua]|uniref:Protein YIPF n=1 Tax=Nitzschia inconspicua TaxID=303405 RepID=A0A9K3LGV1_9STRA|nr:Yip1 domain containing protein [Nitzschia inconspicua]